MCVCVCVCVCVYIYVFLLGCSTNILCNSLLNTSSFGNVQLRGNALHYSLRELGK